MSDQTAEIVVVGAGLAGIGMGIELRKRGFRDFLILEQSDGVGGTWKRHTYPGLTCDIPAFTYSFSFEQKPDWSSIWAPQSELLAYCEHCTEKYGLKAHLRYGCAVEEASYDQERNLWQIRSSTGIYTSRYLINCSGYLSTPKTPDLPGLEDFAGEILHSSQWRDDLDLSDKRVGLIGTGATAIQLAPALPASARSLTVFQRTPIWLLPKPSLRLPSVMQAMFAHVPGAQRAVRLLTAAFQDLVFFRVFTDYRQTRPLARLVERLGRWHICRQVENPDTQRRLTPSYSWGCKRPSFSNDFYPIFNQENVSLVTAPISGARSGALLTEDGREHGLDVLIFATGYQPFERGALPTYPVRGRTGQTLDEYWNANRYQAYRGFAVHGYPNFFLISGPYSIISTSYVAMIEIAARSISACLNALRNCGADFIEVKADAQKADHMYTLRRKKSSVWQQANCAGSNTYYVDRFGDTPGFRPRYHHQEWLETRRSDMSRFVMRNSSHAPERGLEAMT